MKIFRSKNGYRWYNNNEGKHMKIGLWLTYPTVYQNKPSRFYYDKTKPTYKYYL